jgi:hypothetical protein
MDKIVFVDFETKICSAFLNAVSDTVWDALGQAKTPQAARTFIGAVEEAPADGGMYLRSNNSWQSATTSLQHNALSGRSQPDAHPIAAITGLQTDLDGIKSKNTSQDAAIALKADKTYVDSENDAQDTLISNNAAAIATKADITYVNTLDAANVKKTSNTGTALIPAGTEGQRDASPQLGAIRFSSTAVGWEGWNGTNWVAIGGGQMYGNALVKGVFYNAQSIAENITVKSGANGLSAGPIQVENGFAVTVEPGSVWSVV